MQKQNHLWKSVCLAALLALASDLVVAQQTEYGFVMAGYMSTFWKAMKAGAQKAAAENNVKILVRAPQDDRPEIIKNNVQLMMINEMIQLGVSGLVIAPMPVTNNKKIIQLKVPVILVDRDSKDFQAASLIATDNYAAGQIAARSLKDKLGAGSKVGVLRLDKTVTSTTEREEGFIHEAKALGFKIVLDKFIGHGIRESEAQTAAEILKHKGKIDAIFTPNEPTTFGALKAFAAMPSEKRPLHVGFDYRIEFKEAIQSGALFATVVQDPAGMAYRAVTELIKSEGGKKKIKKSISVDVLVVTAKSLSDADFAKKLSQYEEN